MAITFNIKQGNIKEYPKIMKHNKSNVIALFLNPNWAVTINDNNCRPLELTQGNTDYSDYNEEVILVNK